MQVEQVLIAVAILCIALIVLIMFICKEAYKEGYLAGYEDVVMEPLQDTGAEYEQDFLNARKAA